jgi:hypothetical protein
MTTKADSKVLAKRFNLGELRHKLHIAETNYLPALDDYPYWHWLFRKMARSF